MDQEQRNIFRQTFRSRLRKEVLIKFVSMSKLASRTGINSATLSLIFNDEQGMNPAQLDAITEALEYPAGYFYQEYIHDCFIDGHVNYSRLMDFLPRCYIHNQKTIASALFEALINDSDKGKVLQTILMVGEKLFDIKMEDEAEGYYDQIIKREDKVSSRLAIAVLRKYTIARKKDDLELTTQYFNKLIYMAEALPASHEIIDFDSGKKKIWLQCEAYFLITRYFNSLEDWDNVYRYACLLQNISDQSSPYYAEALLYQFSALRETGRTDEALEINKKVANINERFARYSVGNELLIRVEAGDQDSIRDVLSWIKNDDEMKLFLPIMFDCYLMHKNYDAISKTIDCYQHLFRESFNPIELLNKRRKSRLFVALAEFYFIKKETDLAINYLIDAINLSRQARLMKRYDKCMLLFIHYIDDISIEQRDIVKQQFMNKEA